jgi:hypothetical protein
LSALWLATATGWRSERGLFIHFVYLAEACVLLRWFNQDGIEHVHVHFGTNPAAVAMLCRELGGPSYSFTSHGPDAETYARASSAELAPQKIDNTMAFMFETRWTVVPTEHAITADHLQADYDAVWSGLTRNFQP